MLASTAKHFFIDVAVYSGFMSHVKDRTIKFQLSGLESALIVVQSCTVQSAAVSQMLALRERINWKQKFQLSLLTQ